MNRLVVRRASEDAFDRSVKHERARQDAKWGPKPAVLSTRDPELLKMLAVIAEEFGEVARAILELRAARDLNGKVDHLSNLRAELVETAACCRALWGQLPDATAESEAPFFDDTSHTEGRS